MRGPPVPRVISEMDFFYFRCKQGPQGILEAYLTIFLRKVAFSKGKKQCAPPKKRYSAVPGCKRTEIFGLSFSASYRNVFF